MKSALCAAVACCVVSFAAISAAPQARAQSVPAVAETKGPGRDAGDPSPARRYFTDVELLDQDGNKLALYTDLLKGKVVVIQSFFTSCDGSCPLLTSRFAKIQEWLGDRQGKDVYLLSFSVDPDIDSPEKLKTYAGKLGARGGWRFVTGTRPNLQLALHKLGLYAEQPEQHKNLVLIGNEPTGLWKKVRDAMPPRGEQEEVRKLQLAIESALNNEEQAR